jgi:hypothetical protein
MKTRIEDAFDKWFKEEKWDLMLGDFKDFKQGFIAGAEFMQSEVEKLKAQNEIMRDLMYRLYNALNFAHGYIDPRENKRTDKLCMEALCEYESLNKLGEV